jgi:acyl-CoA synthetase (NDP forming)
MTSAPDLHNLFYPRSIAVVGSSTKRGFVWSSGNAYINGCIKQSFHGKIFPVHPSADYILGYKCYRTIRDIRGDIDLVIFCVPASAVLDVMDACAEKKVKFVHLLTAGFTETGRASDAEVEKKLVEKARMAGIRIVGPNCMGLYCPEGGLSWNSEMPDKIGKIGMFSQSGQLATMSVASGASEGLFFSKVVSFGNASDLKAHDYLNYMAEDPKIEIIVAYLEGLTEGRAFFDAAKKISALKPLVVWKGGQTEGGARATQSHTAAMAGSFHVWQSMCRQAGIIPVNSMEEMIYTISAVKRLSLPRGSNIAVLGGAGGGGVTMTDHAEKAGLHVPHLSEKSIAKLQEVIPLEGSSVRNPLDILPHLRSRENFQKLMELLKEDPHIDALFFALHLGFIYRDAGRVGVNYFVRIMTKLQEWLEKPIYLILETFGDAQLFALRREVEETLVAHKTAVFPSFEIAAGVMKRLLDYSEYKTMN